MSSPKRRTINGLAALSLLAALACTSHGDGGGTEPGSISLAISGSSATVMQGGSQQVSATLTRIGSFAGTVALTVTGQPDGVTATVSGEQTSGAVTTATVTLLVGAAVPGTYPLVVHGTGTGVSEATAAFALTVSTANLGFSISLSAPVLSIVQGDSAPTTTVNIARDQQQGAVELEVTGLPTGVAASFDPTTPGVTGSSSVLTLTVSAQAAPGSYSLQVNASDPEQVGYLSVPLALTVTGLPSYILALSAVSISVPQASSSPFVNVYLNRSTFSGNIALSVENLPTGVSAVFYPGSPISGGSTELWLHADASAPTGTFTNVRVRGVAAGLTDRVAPLTLTITLAPYLLTLSSSELSIAQGTAATTTVQVIRNTLSGPVEVWADNGDFHGGMPLGITATVSPNPVFGNSAVLTLTVSAAAVPGVYSLWVYGSASTGYFEGTPLRVTVVAP